MTHTHIIIGFIYSSHYVGITHRWMTIKGHNPFWPRHLWYCWSATDHQPVDGMAFLGDFYTLSIVSDTQKNVDSSTNGYMWLYIYTYIYMVETYGSSTHVYCKKGMQSQKMILRHRHSELPQKNLATDGKNINVPNSHWLVDEKRGVWRTPWKTTGKWWWLIMVNHG